MLNAADKPLGQPQFRSASVVDASVLGGERADAVSIDATFDWLLAPRLAPRTGWTARWTRLCAGLRLRPWRARLRATLFVTLLAGLIIFGGGGGWRDAASPQRHGISRFAQRPPPPIDAPFAARSMRPLAPAAAIAWNAAAPLASGLNPPAAPFVAALATPSDYQQAATCLTLAIYYEAGNEPDSGQRAVAQVVLNRLRHPAYPHTVCGVVFQGAQAQGACQFTFACDGAMQRIPAASGWQRATRVAMAALGGNVYAPIGLATHYHADYVVPYWAASLDKVGSIGAHVFYRWSGAWGRRGAFSAGYAGGEPGVPGRSVAVPDAAPPPADALPSVAVDMADRPVLIAEVTAAAGDRATHDAPVGAALPLPATKAVGLHERWIVPQAGDPAASPATPTLAARPVVIEAARRSD